MSEQIKDGGQLFPRGNLLHGISIRDYFAAQAMSMAFNKAIHNWREDGEQYLGISCDFIAGAAYDMADAMLAARGRE